jgi:hypothetical protein
LLSRGWGWVVVGVVVGAGVGVAPPVVEAAAALAVVLGGGSAFGGFVDVVDLEAFGDLVAGGVEAGAVADLDGSA